MNNKKLLNKDDKTVDELVKIQSTDFDRKRKLKDYQIKQMKKLYKSGCTISKLAIMFNVNPTTVRYNVDENWKDWYNVIRSGKHTGVTHCDFLNRVNYKRALLEYGRI